MSFLGAGDLGKESRLFDDEHEVGLSFLGAGDLGKKSRLFDNAVRSTAGPVITLFTKSHASLFLCVTRQGTNGVFFFIEGENYILKFTDWAHEEGTVRLMLFVLFGLWQNGSLNIVPQGRATVFSIPEFSS